MSKFPFNITDFKKIRQNNMVYIDKTEELFTLLNESGYCYVLNRPHGFGKSLLISTLKHIFLGDRELFEGLSIYDKLDWTFKPVIHIDFSTYSLNVDIDDFISEKLIEIGTQYGVELEKCSVKQLFNKLVSALHNTSGKRSVVLIDNYDRPVSALLHNKEQANQNRESLIGFYEMFKSLGEDLDFVLLAGIYKISMSSIFSGFNNYIDISDFNRYQTLTGFTEDELSTNLTSYIDDFAEHEDSTREKIIQKIEHWYSGYSFNGEVRLYNPRQIISVLSKKHFSPYFSGIPDLLIDLLIDKNVYIPKLGHDPIGDMTFYPIDAARLDYYALLYWSGILTIDHIETISMGVYLYHLRFPGFGVKEAFLTKLLARFLHEDEGLVHSIYLNLLDSLDELDTEEFVTHIRTLFTMLPSKLHLEEDAFFSSLFYAVLSLIDADINPETRVSLTKVDGIITFTDKVVIIEMNTGSFVEALQNIEEVTFYKPYLNSGKKIILLSVGGFKAKSIEYRLEVIN